jgi:hypothetical protein
MTCTASGIAVEGWYNNTGTATDAYADDVGNSTIVTDSDDSSYYGLTPGVVTNSSLCDFGEQFRLIFTPDMRNYSSSSPAYKLSDSNPGQFFYNVFYVNEVLGANETITLEIPYPFVTQGANPVHVYGGLTVSANGETCFLPNNELQAYGLTFGLGDYTDTNGDGAVGYGDVYKVQVPAELGFQYVNIHLDYGLEKTDGWIRKGGNVKNDPTINPDLAGQSIEDDTAHTFSAYADGGLIDGSRDTIYNLNEFKQVRGFGGLVQEWNEVLAEYEPVEGVVVVLLGPQGLIETMVTDGDGWFLSEYTHKGKETTYTLFLPAFSLYKEVTVGKSVKYGDGTFKIGGPEPIP